MSRFAWKGNICHADENRRVSVFENSYVLCEDGICKGIVPELPDDWKDAEVTDFGDRMIIPGLINLHVRAPQYNCRGIGMDLELLDWLRNYAFPEEAAYSDLEYAKNGYSVFIKNLKNGPVTRASVFASPYVDSTELFMEMLEKTGLKTYVGKINMDRNCPDFIREESAEFSASETERWLLDTKDKFENTKPILTPRFIPSCTDELMTKIGELQKKYGVPVQSNVSENPSEIKWVSELCPDSEFYGDAYDRFGLFGGENCPTIMVHCVYSDEREQKLIKERGVWIAHCPQANTNVASGIAPVRQFLDNGLKVGLSTNDSVFRAMVDTVLCSKLRWRLVDDSLKPLTMDEAFYLATRGGGSFFGKVGCFEPGYEMDAVVIDDSAIYTPKKILPHDRFERMCYLHSEAKIVAKCVAGKLVDIE